MDKINNGGPAFPIPLHSNHCPCSCGNEGMSLRQYYAGCALTGLITVVPTIKGGVITIEIASKALELADAMLKAEGVK